MPRMYKIILHCFHQLSLKIFKHVLLERMEETVGRIVLPDAMIVYVTVSTDLVYAKTERRDIQTVMKVNDTGYTAT